MSRVATLHSYSSIVEVKELKSTGKNLTSKDEFSIIYEKKVQKFNQVNNLRGELKRMRECALGSNINRK